MRAFLIIGLLLAGNPTAWPAEKHDQAAVDKAVERGIAFLISKQHSTGAIADGTPPSLSYPHAMTGLASLALVAVGHRPADESPAGQALRKALEYLLDEKRLQSGPNLPPGYFGGMDGSRMYGHGIVTLFLAEMVGMGVDARQDALIRTRCQAAIDLIVRSQKVKKTPNFTGGWRYTPLSSDADLSVTVWQVMALRAAKNAGLTVPKETIDAAVEYIKRSYSSPRDKDGKIINLKSGFSYMPGGGPGYAAAAAGLLALQVCGEYDAPELNGATEWLRLSRPKTVGGAGHFYYGTYYFSQGMYQRGGTVATESKQFVESLLLAAQKENGTWTGGGTEASPVYCTALAILSLSVRHHFMPIYQR
ncbi:MAG: hypothetical protein PCFJNLEI_02447 [Verrucomicrobiae bacterium]|nr:hypothetical protein [Verrucomicrobiae bacterium]